MLLIVISILFVIAAIVYTAYAAYQLWYWRTHRVSGASIPTPRAGFLWAQVAYGMLITILSAFNLKWAIERRRQAATQTRR